MVLKRLISFQNGAMFLMIWSCEVRISTVHTYQCKPLGLVEGATTIGEELLLPLSPLSESVCWQVLLLPLSLFLHKNFMVPLTSLPMFQA